MSPFRLIVSVIFSAAIAFVPSKAASQTFNFDFMTGSPSGSYLAGSAALYDLDVDYASLLLMDAARAQRDNLDIQQRAFGALAASGRFEDATELAQHLLALDPNYDVARLIVGTTAIKQRRYSSAAKSLERIGLEDFVGITAAVLRAWTEIGNDNLLEGIDILDDLGQIGLSDFLLFHRGLMLDMVGQPTAIEQMAQAYKRDPFVSNVVEAYVRMLGNAGRFGEAQAVLDNYFGQGLQQPNIVALRQPIAERRAPGKFAKDIPEAAAQIFETLGLALTQDGAPDIAMVFLQAALYLNPDDDETRIAIAELLKSLEQYDAANEFYESVPRDSLFASAAIVQLADNLDAMGHHDEAIRRLGNIVAIEPENTVARAALADKLRFDEQFEDAIEQYSVVLDQLGGDRPRHWIYYYLRGIAYERTAQWPKAEADMQRALELNPDQPQVLNYLGYSWVDRGEHLQEALSMIERAVRANPQDGYIVDSLGWAYYKLGRFDEAVIILEQAVRLSPNDPEINDHLGDAYWQVGRKREARFQWTIASDEDTNGNVAERSLAKLENGLIEGETHSAS